MKLLLACGKTKPYLYYNWNTDTYHVTNSLKDLRGDFGGSRVCSGADRLCAYQDDGRILTNGHIMAECDFEVEELEMVTCYDEYDYDFDYQTYKTPLHQILKSSYLTFDELCSYLKYKDGYAIHIKNLHIFDKPKELEDYYTFYKAEQVMGTKSIKSVPKTMMYCYEKKKTEKCILISVKPEEACRILNGKQTFLVRKKILKKMK